MKISRAGVATAAILLLAAALASLGVAQAQMQPPAERSGGPSSEVRARLYDGRIAMIKVALRLNEEQLKLWAPLETQLRAAFAARQRARAERPERWKKRDAERASLADRLDRRSKRLTERAERRALTEAFRPFYASLNDEQKAVARVVLRPVLGGPRRGQGRMMMRSAYGEEEDDNENENRQEEDDNDNDG
jgi:hypothetical protein